MEASVERSAGDGVGVVGALGIAARDQHTDKPDDDDPAEDAGESSVGPIGAAHDPDDEIEGVEPSGLVGGAFWLRGVRR